MVKLVSELKKGETGRVYKITKPDALRIRLFELGFLPGTCVKFIRTASVNGPLEVLLRGYTITIGLQEAKSIYVEIES